ncbi:MAG TPA: BON domain-containing protein [Gammaproteobacteria bacterium]|nr:BON domain-containing protein [Gammaproteobacteria bacterium]
MRRDHFLRMVWMGLLAAGLNGCAAVMFGGVATGAGAAHDNRTTGTIVEDEAIELKASKAFFDNKAVNDQAHINVTSYNNIVLVTGETPTAELHDEVVNIVKNISKVRKVYDELAIAAPSSLTSRSSDTLLTGKVKAQIFGMKDFDPTRVKVVTERGIVYLLGLITKADGDRVTDVARQVGGVQKVVKLFEYTG